MIYISKIYTKTGDDGSTGLGDGSRRPKDDTRVDAYGTVDELNSTLGLLLAQCPDFAEGELLRRASNDLFDVGADLCMPIDSDESAGDALRIGDPHIDRLEQSIDRLNRRLEPLKSFILPGGSLASAWLHLARTVCRRAERATVTLQRAEPINPNVPIYLNRLSDLLFVLARIANNDGKDDVLWKPGDSAKS